LTGMWMQLQVMSKVITLLEGMFMMVQQIVVKQRQTQKMLNQLKSKHKMVIQTVQSVPQWMQVLAWNGQCSVMIMLLLQVVHVQAVVAHQCRMLCKML